MPKQSMHRTSHQEDAGVTVGELIRPARPAMIVTGLLTAVGALMSIVPFEALRNMAAIWLGETSPEGWRGSLWIWAAIAVGALFASQALYLAGLGITHLAEARLRHHLRERVVDAISSLPLGRVAQIPHGTIRKMVCDDTTSIHTLVAHVPGDATNAVVMAAAGTAYLLWTDWRLACALVGDPEVLILDEPTVGLDPLTRQALWELFRDLAGRGTTLLVSSHVMDEATRCDSVLFMRDGWFLAHEPVAVLQRRTETSTPEDAFMALIEEAA